MTITRENRRDNQEWTIEIYRQHWAQNIQRRQTQQNHRTLKRRGRGSVISRRKLSSS